MIKFRLSQVKPLRFLVNFSLLHATMAEYIVLPPENYPYNPEIVADMEQARLRKPPYPLKGPGERPKFSDSSDVEDELDDYFTNLREWSRRSRVYKEERKKFIDWHGLYIQWERAVESDKSDEVSEERDTSTPTSTMKRSEKRVQSSKPGEFFGSGLQKCKSHGTISLFISCVE